MICLNCYRLQNIKLPKFSTSIRYLSKNYSSKSDDTSKTETKRGIRVAIIGCPNAGKSALTNALTRANVCAVSKQIDTTRHNSTSFLTEDNCQIAVVDSPGLIGTKHAKKFIGTHSDAKILIDPENAINSSSHMFVVQDVSARGEYIQHRILHLLHRYSHIPSTLVLNKIDLLPRRSDLLRLADILTENTINGEQIQSFKVGFGKLDNKKLKQMNEKFSIHPAFSCVQKRDEEWHALYNRLIQKPAHRCSWAETRKLYLDQNGWPHFKSVFFLSSVTGEGVESLREYIKELSSPLEWHYDKNTVTTKEPKAVCLENIRSKFLDYLPPYIAYSLKFFICEWELLEPSVFSKEKTQILKIIVDVICDKERSARLADCVTSKVEENIIVQLENLFRIMVHLRIQVKCNGKVYLPILKVANYDKKIEHL